jgi:hypothetical protein
LKIAVFRVTEAVPRMWRGALSRARDLLLRPKIAFWGLRVTQCEKCSCIFVTLLVTGGLASIEVQHAQGLYSGCCEAKLLFLVYLRISLCNMQPSHTGMDFCFLCVFVCG